MKTPTLRQKVKMYEDFLHKINLMMICVDNFGVKELVTNADIWSYSHRCGEFVSDKQRKKSINTAFWKLCDTPETDKNTKERQKKYTELNNIK